MSVSSSVGYMTLSGVFSLVEGRFYTFEVLDGSTLIYRGKIFCTSQTDYDKYTTNDGVYTEEQSYDNEFIIL